MVRYGPLRVLLVAFVLVLACPPVGVTAVQADSGSTVQAQTPSAFIQKLGDETLAMMANTSLAAPDRTAEFRRLLGAGFDMRTIAQFVLGHGVSSRLSAVDGQ